MMRADESPQRIARNIQPSEALTRGTWVRQQTMPTDNTYRRAGTHYDGEPRIVHQIQTANVHD